MTLSGLIGFITLAVVTGALRLLLTGSALEDSEYLTQAIPVIQNRDR